MKRFIKLIKAINDMVKFIDNLYKHPLCTIIVIVIFLLIYFIDYLVK